LYKHPSVSPALTQGILERDARDSSRDVAPLQPAADAVIIDTSHLDADAVLAEAMRWVAIKLPGLAQQP
jgi:cytidylate kinase